jgi:hypothetical protein
MKIRQEKIQSIKKKFSVSALILIFAMLSSSTITFSQVPELLYYKFNNPGKLIINSANPATAVGNDTIVINDQSMAIGGSGFSGTALLSGSNWPTIYNGWTPNLTGSFTIGFWISDIFHDASTECFIFGTDYSGFTCTAGGGAGAGNLKISGSGLPTLILSNSGIYTPKMYHVVYNAAASQFTGYLNGVQVISFPVTSPVSISGYQFKIGSGNTYQGKLDEFRFYNRALSASEIQATWDMELTDSISSNDAGVSNIISPAIPVAPGIHPVIVNVRNFGSNPINSISVNWSVNGVLQTPFTYSGIISVCSKSGPITLGSFNFPAGNNIVKAWTSNPNYLPDTLNFNDTVSSDIFFSGPLSGSYTIGGASPDFHSFSSAVNALYKFGVNGPVIFNVASGTYNEQIRFLNNPPGMSAQNTVTFQSSAGDSTKVILQYQATNSVDNWVIYFDTTQYWTFKQMSIIALGLKHARVLYFRMSTSWINFNGCILKSNPIGLSHDVTIAYTHLFTGGHHVAFNSTRFLGGYCGISWEGNSVNGKMELTVINCSFEENNSYGIYISKADSALIHGNTFISPSMTDAFYRGIDVYFAGNNDITCNRILGKNAHNFRGISVIGGLPNYVFLIANNYISYTGTENLFTPHGMYISSSNIRIYHNSVFIQGGSDSSSSAINVESANIANIDIRNNIFANFSGGYAYTIKTPAAIIASDYNDYYATASKLAFWTTSHASLASLAATNLKDQHSVSIDPIFGNPQHCNLLPLNSSLNNSGQYIGISTDILGNSRSVQSTDMGAAEFTGISNDLALVGAAFEENACPGSNDSIFLSITNLIGATVNFSVDTLMAHWWVDGPVNSSGTIVINSGSLSPAASMKIANVGVNLSLPGKYLLSCKISANNINLYAGNDTLAGAATRNIIHPLIVTPDKVLITNMIDTVKMLVKCIHDNPGYVYFSEICYWKTTVGEPTTGWPSWLIADDYVEITGAPNSHLGGLTHEVWDTTQLLSSYTFPPGTFLGTNGTAIIGIGGPTYSYPSPSNYYYHGNVYAYSYTSNLISGHVLKNGAGNIFDAVGYGNFNFPLAANVPPMHWSNPNPVSPTGTSGIRLSGLDFNNGTNWMVTSSTNRQNPNTVNPGTIIPISPPTTNFTWSLNGVVISNSVRNIVLGPWSASGLYKYVLSYISPCGILIDTTDITVNLSGVYPGNDTTICQGDSAMIKIDFPGSGPWTVVVNDGTGNDTIFGIISSPHCFWVSPSVTTNYTLVEYWTGFNPSIPINLSTTVTVAPIPSVTFAPLGSTCEYTPPFYLSSGLPVGGTYSGAGVSSGIFDPISSGPGNHLITYTYTDPTGCKSSASQSIIVGIKPIYFLTPDHDICSGDTTQLKVIANGSLSYQWNTTASTPVINVSPVVSTTYTVTITDVPTGCFADDEVVVNVNPVPVVKISGYKDTICLVDQIFLDAGAGFTTYTWSNQANSQLISVLGTNIGSGNTACYTVTVTNSFGCKGTDQVCVHAIDCSGVTEISNPVLLEVWPNPSEGSFTIKINGAMGSGDIKVFTLSSTLVYSEQFYLFDAKEKEIHLNNLSSGMYFLHLFIMNKQIQIKILVL